MQMNVQVRGRAEALDEGDDTGGRFRAADAGLLDEKRGNVTEGVTGLIASAMLLYVGFWLHDKSHASAWQGFLMRGAKAIKPGAA